MANKSNIEWTEMTWNPVTGCTKVSQGCKHCYAERMAKRLTAMGAERYRNGFRVTLHPDLVDTPRGWRLPRVVFVNSMSDRFHDDIPLAYPLGDRWRRIRSVGAADAQGMGQGHPASMPGGESPVLLQAMGRHQEGPYRAGTLWAYLQ